MELEAIKKYIGNIAIVGKPNVGKSTLINAIFNEKISIVNQKPQTTRDKIDAVYNRGEFYLTFMDTPGFHVPRNKLDVFLNSQAKASLKEANVVYFLTDITRPIDDEDLDLLNFVKDYGVENIILVITKAETSTQDKIDERIFDWKAHADFKESIIISALHKINIDKLLNITKPFLDYQDVYVNENESTLQEDNFLVKEIVREQCLNLLNKEVPYGVAVMVESASYNAETNVYNIDAAIVVEKDSQKAIVIGKSGSMIKKIGTAARQQLLEIYDSKINLKLFVKVDKDWRDNAQKLKEFGYSK
ncbi:GTPase Era [Ureaplasma ceti]|uniref:GTPase Era n=1 Tax=Ureaplasma ceti TaxID=3119530 RepID=A0ABP9U6D2_9BACT